MSEVTRSIFIRVPPEAIWELVVDHTERMTEWMPHIVEAERLTPGPVRVGSRTRYVSQLVGIRREFVNEVTALEPNRRLDYKSVEGNVEDCGYWLFEPQDDGCQVTFSMTYYLPGAVFGEIADLLVVHRAQEKQIEEGLQNLKERLEHQQQAAA